MPPYLGSRPGAERCKSAAKGGEGTPRHGHCGHFEGEEAGEGYKGDDFSEETTR